jgi:hypothetical protein
VHALRHCLADLEKQRLDVSTEGTVVDLETDRRRPSRKIAAAVEAFIAKSDGDECPEPK